MRVFVTTCDKYLWCLKPFAYLFNVYWSSLQPVVVAGFAEPKFQLPDNFQFHQVNKTNYPAERWSDQVREFLDKFDDCHFVWMLEDFFLRRTVNHQAVESLHEFMHMNDNILRIDLTNDRLFSHDPRYMPDAARWGNLNIIRSEIDWPYHISLQAAIWDRRKLLEILPLGISPWQFELGGADILRAATRPEYQVLGTRQWPVEYTQALKIGVNNIKTEDIPQEQEDFMRVENMIP